MLGFLNLNKPSGYTSHDCVAIVRRCLGIKKVGHGGTLDPTATGVLPIAVGRATRLLRFLPPEKAYEATIRLGVQTDTDDLEGKIIAQHSATNLTLEQIKPQLEQFCGSLEQIPPAYSAIQKDGKRLYELARKGKKVEVPPRRVEIMAVTVVDWHPSSQPELKLAITCGPGTYIRAIARDLGAVLGVGGTLAKLVRTRSCSLELADSIGLEELQEKVKADQSFNADQLIVSPDQPLQHLPAITLDPATAKRWSQGQKLTFTEGSSATWQRVYELPEGKVTLGQGRFLGIAELASGLLSPRVVL